MTPEIAIRAMWGAWCVSWVAAALWSDRAVKRPPSGRQTLYRLLSALGFVLLWGVFRRDLRAEVILWRTSMPLGWVMAAVCLAGLLFTWWARIHLGRLWSGSVTRKADHRVVDTGPYALVRHPIYAGITVASFATAAARGTALAWLGACTMTAAWVIKARLEEEFLRDQLGPAYGDYARRVPMLVPLPGRKASP